MNRRDFIKSQVAGTAILSVSGLVHAASALNLPSPDPKDASILDVDVLVVGGGSAGHARRIVEGIPPNSIAKMPRPAPPTVNRCAG